MSGNRICLRPKSTKKSRIVSTNIISYFEISVYYIDSTPMEYKSFNIGFLISDIGSKLVKYCEKEKNLGV